MQNINFNEKMTNYRWIICAMLFFATTVNYLDRQVLSLTWDEFIKPEFHWDESNYGRITSIFSIFYAVCMLFAGRFVDWMGTKKGYLWAIGVWWFFLFWTPSYLNTQFGIKTSEGLGIALIFTLYAITMLSIYGGKLPTLIINKTGLNPYAARMRAMLIFAFFPLLVLLAQPLGTISPWFPVIMIGIGGAAHQSWSANIFSTVGDMFPKSAIATITGIGGMAGGVGSMLLQWFAGDLFVFAGETNLRFLGFEGKPAGYFIVFCICAVAYLVGWIVMKALVPKYKLVVIK